MLLFFSRRVGQPGFSKTSFDMKGHIINYPCANFYQRICRLRNLKGIGQLDGTSDAKFLPVKNLKNSKWNILQNIHLVI